MARAKVEYEIRAKDQTKGAIAAVKRKFEGLRQSLTGIGAQIAGLVGAAGLGAMVKKSLDLGDQVQKLSVRLGASTEALSEYRLVAERSGVSFETLATGWQRMTRRAAEAAGGMGPAKDAFAELGINAEAFAKLRPEDQFEQLADALAGVEDQSRKVALAQKVLDSEGVRLLQTMQGGAGAMREVREEARAMGLSLSTEQANQMAAANDAVTNLQAAFNGLVNELAVNMAPGLADFADGFRSHVIPIIKTTAGAFERFVSAIGAVAAGIASLARGEFAGALEAMRGAWEEMTDTAVTGTKQTNKNLEGQRKALDQVAGSMGHVEAQTGRAAQAITNTTTTAAAGFDSLRDQADEAARAFESLMGRLFPLQEAAKQYARDMETINNADISPTLKADALQKLDEAFATATGGPRKLAKATEEAGDAMSTFAEQAARNMQDSFAAFLFDPFDGGIKGMVKGFSDTLRRMAAEAAAAQIFDNLGLTSGNFLSGIFGTRAAGGAVAGGLPYLVGENGPELFVPSTNGRIDRNSGGGGVTVNVNVTGGNDPGSRQSAGQIGLQVARVLDRYQRRNG